MSHIDLTGSKYGKLTVINKNGFTDKNKFGYRHAIWHCLCDCGNYVDRTTDVLKRGHSSCGCSNKENLERMAKKNITHNASKTGAYRSYKAMMGRCYREKDIHFNAYGKRGITVCEEWKGNPKSFIEWAMKNGWKEHLTLERIDNNKGYSADNCCWIIKEMQPKNKRQNIMITYDGETLCAEDWSKKTGINAQAIRWRYKHGWDIDSIFNTLPQPYSRKRGK